MSETAHAQDRLARLQSALGVLPLGAYLVFHLWEQWPALDAREAWVDRVRATTSRPWEIALVIVPLALHAGLGLARFVRRRRTDTAEGPDARGLARLQAVTGVVALAFIGYHLTQIWSLDSGPHASTRDAYAVLWHALGRPRDLAIYLVGITCVCFHFAHGLSRAAATWGLAPDRRAIHRARLAAGVAGFALWLAALHLVGHFAVGQGLLQGPMDAVRRVVTPGPRDP